MDQERNSNNNNGSAGDKNNTADEIMLPGFRFHPTDEELVGFYLRRKTLQRPLSIELIKQLDIYKYDPWDLPKLATMSGEKEWYFYCPRDRKYRNSARPNRVTEAGFWKATGTDRPIYSSSESSSTKCNKIIGLKKSLVFYKGRAAKGTKTDWMMHEFRLPSSFNHSSSASNCKRFISNKDNHNIPAANDAWAICRIFKKVNSTAQRATSHFWGSTAAPPLLHQPPETFSPHDDDVVQIPTHPHDNMSHQLTSTTNCSLIHFGDTNHNKVMLQSSKSSNDNPTLDDRVLTYKYSTNQITTQENLSAIYTTFQTNNAINQALEPLLINEASNSTFLSSNIMPYFGDFGSIPQQHIGNYACPLPQDLRRNLLMMSSSQEQQQMANLENHEYWSVSNDEQSLGSFAHVNFPLNLVWDSMPCPSDVSSTFSTNKHYI